VRVIDSFAYGRRDNLDTSDPGVRVDQVKLCGGCADKLVEPLNGVDYLFHLAAEKHNQSIDSPERVLDANVSGTYELLRAAADAGVKKCVFTSSLYAYGKMAGPPMKEGDLPAPQTIYGISKLAGEHLCRYFSLHRGLSTVCLRLFFVYGPRQYAGLGYKSVIVSNFERLLNGKKPFICGSGTQKLDYIHVDDVVSALVLAAASDISKAEVFNVGSGYGPSINELTERMMRVAGVVKDCEHGPADFTEGSSRVADTTKYTDYFGMRPSVVLEDGLRRTLEWIISSTR